MLDRDNPLPLYMQLKEIIREEIQNGKRKSGEHIPYEEELCKMYKVSRITVTHALRELAEEGLLVRIKRKGTFVASSDELQKRANIIPRRYKSLAFIIPDIEDIFISEIYRGIAQAATENGYKVIVLSSDRLIKKEIENIETLKEGKEDGAIIFPNWGRANAEQIFELKREGYPFVLVNRYFRDIQTDYVVTDNEMGAFLAVQHLINLGHRRIGCIGWVECTAIEDRLKGYRRALGAAKIPYDESLVRSIFDEGKEKYSEIEPSRGGYEEMKKLLAMKERPTAVFAVSDRLAVGALKAIREQRESVPEYIALVGFDDVMYASFLELTTVAQPSFETGKKATEILIEKIERIKEESRPREFQQVVLKPKLIIRKSCGASLRQQKLEDMKDE